MIRILFLIIMIDLIPAISWANQIPNDPCRETILPLQVREAVTRNFPAWRPLRTADLIKDDQELWLQAKPNLCPGFTAGHFKNMKHLSYAVILVGSDIAKGYKLIILSTDMDNNLKTSVLFQDEKKDLEQDVLYPVVHSLPPGEYQDFYESSKKVQTKVDAIALERLEAWMTMFYYEHGVFKQLQLSD